MPALGPPVFDELHARAVRDRLLRRCCRRALAQHCGQGLVVGIGQGGWTWPAWSRSTHSTKRRALGGANWLSDGLLAPAASVRRRRPAARPRGWPLRRCRHRRRRCSPRSCHLTPRPRRQNTPSAPWVHCRLPTRRRPAALWPPPARLPASACDDGAGAHERPASGAAPAARIESAAGGGSLPSQSAEFAHAGLMCPSAPFACASRSGTARSAERDGGSRMPARKSYALGMWRLARPERSGRVLGAPSLSGVAVRPLAPAVHS